MAVMTGRVPGWALGPDGDGSGYGYGDGSGYGYGYPAGYGDGDGDGSGHGSGSGDIERCRPHPVRVTSDQLRGACADQVRVFRRTFPRGATWPADIPRAAAAGLDIEWACEHLGLLQPIGGDCGEKEAEAQ